ncbi:MAG: nucleotidyltransferase domain-containing protein [Nanoarchaeota archaeon]
MEEVVKKILKEDVENKVKFIILYGSQSNNNSTPMSDIDLAIYYDGDKRERFNFRIKISGLLNKKYDVQTFQDLPLQVKKEVIKGKVLHQKDYQFFFDQVMQVIKEYDFFKKYLDMYYEGVQNTLIYS